MVPMTAGRAHLKRIGIAYAKLRVAGTLRCMAEAWKREQRRDCKHH
jgi:hypothetical protein